MQNDLSVWCIKYGESYLSESMIFENGSKEKQLPISFSIYLIKCGVKNILIDAGCDTMPGFDMKNFHSPVTVLAELGFSPDDISDVIITHSHHDHIDALRHFENAHIYISEQEFIRAKEHLKNNKEVTVFNSEYTLTPQIKIVEIGGHFFGSSIVELYLNKSVYVFAGDECYVDDCISSKKITGTYINRENSVNFIEKYSNPKYKVFTCHDPSLKTQKIL